MGVLAAPVLPVILIVCNSGNIHVRPRGKKPWLPNAVATGSAVYYLNHESGQGASSKESVLPQPS